jgi:predicted pyridoxine 5'-phosphate oxidase superfamily flavin-nucleotide-binding protein
MTATVFHEGERAVQRRAGVERIAAQVGRNILPWIPAEHGEFLRRQPYVILAGRDAAERVWASLLVGGVGFARALDERHVLLSEALAPQDPLAATLATPGSRIGILAIEADSRTRIRLNGVVEPGPDGIVVTIDEAFGNCPKYIQRRLPVERLEPPPQPRHRVGTALDEGQLRLVRSADTFFIASSHAQRGADASHRGGRPGFVEVSDDGTRLRFPDYQGNRMFQTLGNIERDPRAGLLFLDWQTGTALQLTGRARIVWDEAEIASRPGAQRLVDVEIDAVHEHDRAMPARWRLVETSRLNPPVIAI